MCNAGTFLLSIDHCNRNQTSGNGTEDDSDEEIMEPEEAAEDPPKTYYKCRNEVLEHFKCPVCISPFHPPILTCPNGHNVCENCQREYRSNLCVTCRKPMTATPVRNITLEQLIILYRLAVPCKYHVNGCTLQTQVKPLLIHELTCWHQSLPCPMVNCHDQDVTLMNMKDHLEGKHPSLARGEWIGYLRDGQKLTFVRVWTDRFDRWRATYLEPYGNGNTLWLTWDTYASHNWHHATDGAKNEKKPYSISLELKTENGRVFNSKYETSWPIHFKETPQFLSSNGPNPDPTKVTIIPQIVLAANGTLTELAQAENSLRNSGRQNNVISNVNINFAHDNV